MHCRLAASATLIVLAAAGTPSAQAESKMLQPTDLGFKETREAGGVEFIQKDMVFMGAVSTTAAALKDVTVKRLVRTGLALTTDNRWAHWRVEAGARRIVDLSEITVAANPPASWQAPDKTALQDQSAAAPRLADCRFLSAADAGRRWIGAWRCAPGQTTLASWPRDAPAPTALVQEAVVGHAFSVISTMPSSHGGGAFVQLAEVDGAEGRIDYLRLFWRH